MLLIEIWLTVSAWRKGWGPRALLPFGILFAFVFFVAVGVGMSGGALDNVKPLFFLGDLGVVGALLVMRKHAPQTAAAPVTPAPAVVVAALEFGH